MNPLSLPPGCWLNIARLPLGITEEELSAFFREHGLDIGPECISIKDFASNSGAFVSMQDEVILALFNRAINGDALGEHLIIAELRHRR